uniref:Uncharacterized protein n=1 Tax=Chromera velia CCMP2878 TaxID=1169474 RepID=A0A0G4I6G3_9ALVE|eukprot:Cvel_11384.t1-p1 / transcript=Cvel_11384.t1 / gene=Cvel_11384 / organism=Chromera_velia_CCMP2878 / gene_product=hypothetical protein / transcript_product=hypothetical protein / location=Cvel_scaffold714:7117-8411(+) / protein_length=399 / sequence_SO=supercontig / SO=protein_coding / is_pseudo=false
MAMLGLALGDSAPALQELDLRWWEEGDEGVRGLAEGLGGGRLSFLRDLSLSVYCGVGGEGETECAGEGCRALAEVLSTGKVPSLRTMCLNWLYNAGFVSLCEGLSRGSIGPSVMVDVEFGWRGEEGDLGMTRFAEVIRAGKLSGLRKVDFHGGPILSPAGARVFGEALTHTEACLNSLNELGLQHQRGKTIGPLLESLSSGPGRLPALRSLRVPPSRQSAQSLSTLVSGGRVPSLRDLTLDLLRVGQEAMQAFAAALSTPRISALRKLDVAFCGVDPSNAAAEVRMFSDALSSGHLRRALSEVLLAEKLPSLRTLEAVLTWFTDDGVRALTGVWMSRPPPPLQHLNLRGNQLTAGVADALLTLLGSQRMPSLETVDLRGNDIFQRLLPLAHPEVIRMLP